MLIFIYLSENQSFMKQYRITVAGEPDCCPQPSGIHNKVFVIDSYHKPEIGEPGRSYVPQEERIIECLNYLDGPACPLDCREKMGKIIKVEELE